MKFYFEVLNLWIGFDGGMVKKKNLGILLSFYFNI